MRNVDEIEGDLKNIQKRRLFYNLWMRRVPHILGTYTITSSGIVLFLDWLVDRYNLNSLYIDVLLIAIITLVPSIIMVSYFHGRPGKDEWKRAELVGIPVNILCTFICIFIFISPDRLSGDQDEGNKLFKSIAVFFIDNYSNNTADDNLCAALTDGIITSISRLGMFNVKSRTDVLKFRKKITSHKQIEKVLGVDAYIEGSIIKAPDNQHYIANIQLIDVEDGTNIWAGKYEKDFNEILYIPDLIASDVSAALGADLSSNIIMPAVSGKSNNKTFSLLGEGLNLMDGGEYTRSISVFDSLLIIEPNNLRAAFSRGQALEKMGDHANAAKAFEDLLPINDQYSRAEKIWVHPHINDRSKLDDLQLYSKFLVSEKHNIQIIPSTIKGQGQIIYAIDLTTNRQLWKKSLIDPNPYPVIVDDRLFLFSSARGNQKGEATIYGYNIINGKQIYTKEFPRNGLSDRVMPTVLRLEGGLGTTFENMLFLYVRRNEIYELMLFDTERLDIAWQHKFPLETVEEGEPLLYLIESGEQYFVLHAKGINLYLLSAKDGSLVWEKSLEDKKSRFLIKNNKMTFYSKENSQINISNIIDQNLIANYNDIKSGVDSVFVMDNHIIVQTDNRILSLQTKDRLFRGMLNWQRELPDDIVSTTIVLNNIFVLTRSGELFCINGNNGKIKTKNHINDYSNVSFYHDNTKNSFVIFDRSFLMGLDPNSGGLLWKIREITDKHFYHGVEDNIRLAGNRLVFISHLEEKSQLIIKTYNRNTGELLWLSDENLWADYNSKILNKGKTFQ